MSTVWMIFVLWASLWRSGTGTRLPYCQKWTWGKLQALTRKIRRFVSASYTRKPHVYSFSQKKNALFLYRRHINSTYTFFELQDGNSFFTAVKTNYAICNAAIEAGVGCSGRRSNRIESHTGVWKEPGIVAGVVRAVVDFVMCCGRNGGEVVTLTVDAVSRRNGAAGIVVRIQIRIGITPSVGTRSTDATRNQDGSKKDCQVLPL
ncbi:hypothetical protein RvY_08544 [Ramazzottius varieornatus]|uniref:Secreted protein n=1 Tax=Ramazzottius varieornatus TaxID=947166 RepID=A0A1D1V8U9_RAMVA|nr:hypothetical protein RvY_08544 [Ramazzottius varieornatus]